MVLSMQGTDRVIRFSSESHAVPQTVGVLAVLLVRTWNRSPLPEPIATPAPVEPRPVSGVLRVSLHRAVEGADSGWTLAPDPITHTGVWVTGPTY
jgi:hypothetical protein